MRSALSGLVDDLGVAMNDIRSHVMDLRPRSLEEDLAGSVPHLADQFGSRTDIDAAVDVLGDDVPDSSTEEERATIFHVVQEALNNVEKHARAGSVRIALQFEPGRLAVGVRDDGVRFDHDRARTPSRLGLRSMRIGSRFSGAGSGSTAPPVRARACTPRFPSAPPHLTA
jgi:two-component system NarL family sensor kinase